LTDGKNEIEFGWKRCGFRWGGVQFDAANRQVNIRGKSTLAIAGPITLPLRNLQGRVSRCIDSWDIEDLNVLAMLFGVPDSSCGRLGIEVRDSEIVFPSGVRVPRNVSRPGKI
jgi:hypothetical protein